MQSAGNASQPNRAVPCTATGSAIDSSGRDRTDALPTSLKRRYVRRYPHVAIIGHACARPVGSCGLRSTFPRRPAIGLGAGAAHQHGALGVAQTLCLEKRLHALLITDHRKGAGPVGAPQAAFETP